MGDEKSAIVMATRERDRDRDRELLIPVADSVDDASSRPSSSSSSHHTGREVCTVPVAALFSFSYLFIRFLFYILHLHLVSALFVFLPLSFHLILSSH